MKINGSHDPDDQDAAELFPHTADCTRKLRNVQVRGGALSCTCPARARRKTFLYLLRRARKLSYADAYAMIRHQAKIRAERARTPQERQAFLDVASWAEDLEITGLDGTL